MDLISKNAGRMFLQDYVELCQSYKFERKNNYFSLKFLFDYIYIKYLYLLETYNHSKMKQTK